MSGQHGRSVFVNSCIKKPLSPSSKRPNPSFLVPQCSLDRGMQDPRAQEAMSTITRKKASIKCPLARNGQYRRSKCCSLTHQLRKEADSFQTMVQFYDSIPDYNDLLHLPREEFYCRLNTLKKKQKELKSICFVGENDRATCPLSPEPGSCTRRNEVRRANKHSYQSNVNESVPSSGEVVKENDRSDQATEDGESLHSWSKSPPTVVDTTHDCTSKAVDTTRKGSAKSVRIESTKEHSLQDELGQSSRKYRSGTPYVSDPDDSTTTTKNATPSCATPANSDFVERYDRYVKRSLRCKSASPIRNLANVTIPQPYKMTQREEEQRTLQDLLLASKSAFPSKEALAESSVKQSTQFRANPVPITSRIPLFDTIMADQENRSRLAKLNSEIELQAQIKPFHFSERLNRGHSRCLSRSLSSPALLSTGYESGMDVLRKSRTTFKAKPCPKKLFSSYFHTKAWEDEYFRHLNKRLRAEEMLKQAALPPSMARRERSERKNCLSRHSSEDPGKDRPGSNGGKMSKRKRKSRKPLKRRKSVEQKCAEYFTSVNDPARLHYPTSNSSCSNSTDNNRGSGDTPAPIYPVNRPNLAATLRTEWCRKKLRDMELDDTVTEKKKIPRFRWGVKKSQAFQNLNLDHTHEEELNLRLATRRAEQRLRQEEHAINMELMRQRVKAAPLLLEGPPQWGPRLGHVAHRCSSLNRESEQALFRKPDKVSKMISQKLASTGNSGAPAGSKKCDSPVTTSTTSTGSNNRMTNQEHRQRTAEKRRNAGNGSKLSTYSFDSNGKLSYKACDSELLSLSDV
ncbi:protein FAM161A [Anopheles funestus]|uniref:protein FAM161A n=1 Tax=Anopheles funestus TaxID=62324 RepID=UPI0020C5CAE3|nr:protein FAM161A [Anopheles funestus]